MLISRSTDFRIIDREGKGRPMPLSRGMDLEAFCTVCPPVEEVTSILEEAGFDLVFHIGVQPTYEYMDIPTTPAQYHYSDSSGTEVIYLQGHDEPLDGIALPAHASRFWVFRGASLVLYRLICLVLNAQWEMTWYPAETPQGKHSQSLQEVTR